MTRSIGRHPRSLLSASIDRRRLVGAALGAALGGGVIPVASAAMALEARIGFKAKAIYLDPRITQGPVATGAMLDLIDRTELNALVVDIKENGVFYETGVQFFRDANAVSALYDPAALLAELRRRGIYSIARLVCFKDTPVALARPDLAVIDVTTGLPWRDMAGNAWVNALQPELWAANAALAVEAAELGFDEIQYDYVRFPTDGNLATMSFGVPLSEQARTSAILDFLDQTKVLLAPLGTRLSADIFGFTLLVDHDLGIGQNAELIGDVVDVVCPMVYPSHWPYGSIAVGGVPNDHPYETIKASMEFAKAKLPDEEQRIRPWLQGFSLPGYRPYGAPDVRAQIDAAEAAGVGGWMIWDMANRYQEEAFRPQR
jgi:hypothetical protein